MADYANLAALRDALTTDDAGRRSEAYGAVFGADLEPEDVLGNDPPKDELAEAGVIETEEQRRSRQDILEDILAELQKLTGDGGSNGGS